jgi:hypothetical protein
MELSLIGFMHLFPRLLLVARSRSERDIGVETMNLLMPVAEIIMKEDVQVIPTACK